MNVTRLDSARWIGTTETSTTSSLPRLTRRWLGHAGSRRPNGRPSGRRCRRCGTGSTSCRCTASPKIGPDGHAKRGGFLPPVPLPRRMWAGSQFEFHAAASRRRPPHARVDDRGRDREVGPHRPAGVRQGAPRDQPRTTQPASALIEFHDIVYRDAPRPDDVAPPPTAAPDQQRMAARMRCRRRAAVPLLGADVQRPPHPLRPHATSPRSRAIPGWSCTAR